MGYADVHGDLLPINNDGNYHKAISTASPLLRLFLQRKGKRKAVPVYGVKIWQKRKQGSRVNFEQRSTQKYELGY